MRLQNSGTLCSSLLSLALAASLTACKHSPADGIDSDSRAEIKKKWEFKLGSRADGALARRCFDCSNVGVANGAHQQRRAQRVASQ